MTDLFEPISFRNGSVMKNRLMLAPLTNQQSHPDGAFSREEHDWLVMRAQGGFGGVMTAAAYVRPNGKGFGGQFAMDATYSQDALTLLARDIQAQDCMAIVQLYHGGRRAMPELETVAPSADEKSGARAMTTDEVEAVIEAFVDAAERARQMGFDGVELHGAHGYLLCQFLSPEMNRRDDRYGGSLENRSRPIREIVDGIRKRCGAAFNLGVRLSPELMGVRTDEMLELAGELMLEGRIDYLDMSLWDCFKEPEDARYKGKRLIDWFAGLERGGTRLGAAGQIRSAEAARACLDAGADFVLIGRAAIPEHDFPRRVAQSADHRMSEGPFTPDYLAGEGVGPVFVDYLIDRKFIPIEA